LKFLSIKENELLKASELYKSYLRRHIERVFGWDDSFHEKRFLESYKLENLYWVIVSGEEKALLCYKIGSNAIHIHLILVYDTFQKKGLGSEIMNKLENMAVEKSLNVKLSSFKINGQANNFYKGRGYSITSEDENFYSLLYKNNS
jgi:ribosomal protein S18 acetylase RimI-like enzyme